MSNCVTHHNACACREAHFARLEKELEAVKAAQIKTPSECHAISATLEKWSQGSRACCEKQYNAGYSAGKAIMNVNFNTITEALEQAEKELEAAKREPGTLTKNEIAWLLAEIAQVMAGDIVQFQTDDHPTRQALLKHHDRVNKLKLRVEEDIRPKARAEGGKK